MSRFNTNRPVIVAVIVICAVGLGVGVHALLAERDRSIYAQAVADHSEAMLSEPCELGLDPSSGTPTVDGVIVGPDTHVQASRSCSSDLVAAWTDRRLSDASGGYC